MAEALSQAASASTTLNLSIKLLQTDADTRIRVKLRIPSQRLRDALVLIVKNWRKRSKQVGSQHGPLGFRQVNPLHLNSVGG